MHEVIRKCGQPDYRELFVEEKINGKGKVKKRVIRVYSDRGREILYAGKQTWVYDRGPKRFLIILKFQDSRLNRIQTGGYGSERGMTKW